MLRKDLAKALDLSPSMVSRLAKQGMPTSDVDTARRWRDRHLEKARRKEYRPDTGSPAAALAFASSAWAPQAIASDTSEADAVAHAQRMADLAGELLPLGKLVSVEAELRRALRLVPVYLRAGLLVDPTVWHALTDKVLQAISEPSATFPGPGPDSDLSAADTEWMGLFWFAVAAGEVILLDGNA